LFNAFIEPSAVESFQEQSPEADGFQWSCRVLDREPTVGLFRPGEPWRCLARNQRSSIAISSTVMAVAKQVAAGQQQSSKSQGEQLCGRFGSVNTADREGLMSRPIPSSYRRRPRCRKGDMFASTWTGIGKMCETRRPVKRDLLLLVSSSVLCAIVELYIRTSEIRFAIQAACCVTGTFAESGHQKGRSKIARVRRPIAVTTVIPAGSGRGLAGHAQYLSPMRKRRAPRCNPPASGSHDLARIQRHSAAIGRDVRDPRAGCVQIPRTSERPTLPPDVAAVGRNLLASGRW
jgi:hypothetical protein